MIKQGSRTPAVSNEQEAVEAYEIDRDEPLARVAAEGRWVQAGTPPAPRWRDARSSRSEVVR